MPPVSTGKVHVRVFTEPAPVTSIASAGPFVFVATESELQRWDEDGGVIAMSADHGLPGDHVVALAADSERQWLWVLTEGGLGHYDAAQEVYSEMGAPPAALAIDYAGLAKEGATLASAIDGGVWLGTSRGLIFVSEKGGWVPSPVKDPVKTLLREKGGWLFVGGKGGLQVRSPRGDFAKPQGCELADVRMLVEAPGGYVMAIGSDEGGHERIAIGKETTWTTYRTLPEVAWDGAAKRGETVVLLGGGRAYRISTAGTTARPLSRDGMRLVATSTGAEREWVIDPLELAVPAGATAIASAGDTLLIGTRDLGVARFKVGDAHARDWLRRKQMFEDATGLTVACTKPQDCWVSTGAREAWHWTGEKFEAGGPDQVVLAVARDPDGPVYALHRGAAEKQIHLSRIDGSTWTAVPKVVLETAGDEPEVTFARFAASGSLWVGLAYKDGLERHAYGIAIVEPESGKVSYHRTEAVPDKKMWPVPVGVVDGDVRGDTAWFATNEGVVRLYDGQVKVWTEADGLRSELARAVTISPEGGVIVATGAGAGVWDGKTWAFPPALRFEVNDVVATHNGQVWMATERGIAAWDGKKVRRVDTRRGLAENEVLNVALDQFDRVWARGPSSLTLVSQ
jgi:ligand-binding sensor domain-containing protein